MTESSVHDTFTSPFSWRYGTKAMRLIWSETYKRKLWRRVWLALAEAEQAAGLVMPEQVEDLRAHVNDINIDRALEIESSIHHDLMAELKTYAEQCPLGGGIIHLGATSMDIEDNAEALRIREGLHLILEEMKQVLQLLVCRIYEQAEHVCMAFTHLQPAEPTTIGYRLAGYAQDLLADFEAITRIKTGIRGKGFKGAVGTSASYSQLLKTNASSPDALEQQIMKSLDLEAFTIATQTYPRRQDWEVLNGLAGLAMSIYRIAFDLRILQSPPFGEWSEPFGASQVGSSAMPFKRNPINAENMNSLARYLAALPHIAWDNAAHNLLERTLDDSANRRIIIPEAFLAASELLIRLKRIVKDSSFNEQAIKHNLETYGLFAATERLLMEATRRGGNRQELHELIRKHCLTAWNFIKNGSSNPLAELLRNDEVIAKLLSDNEIGELLQATTYVGDAPKRAYEMAKQIENRLKF
ncbi:MAG: adenylosuccinate lyase [Anaerolineae bacterium]